MQKTVYKTSKIRNRAFYCLDCHVQNELAGNDPIPTTCIDCGGPLKTTPEYDIITLSKKRSDPYPGPTSA